MNLSNNKIYNLLPAFYRIQDIQQGESLRALFDVIAREAGVMEDDIRQLYENWFIETCEEWVVPYIGDLLGISGIHPLAHGSDVSLRAFVANTLAYRRRKGTVSVLEQLSLDITGWRAHAVEFFEILGTTQYFNHIRLGNSRTPDIRNIESLELLNTAFDRISHTVDVRSISSSEGWYNIPNIGIFLWRLQSYRLDGVIAYPVTGMTGCFKFSPLGLDIRLFNRPQIEKDITHLAGEINVPEMLRRQPLYDELFNFNYIGKEKSESCEAYFSSEEGNSVLEIFDGNDPANPKKILPKKILICNLEDWDPKVCDELSNIINCSSFKLAVDPVYGRIKTLNGASFDNLIVSYAYGFSGDVGGGPYNRRESIPESFIKDEVWQVGVSQTMKALHGEVIYPTIAEAIKAWNKLKNPSSGIITIMDNFTYEGGKNIAINIPEEAQLLIVAAGWTEYDIAGNMSGGKERIPGKFSPDELRPHIKGNLKIKGKGQENSLNGGSLFLNGLLLEGNLTVITGNLGRLDISHCTIVPGRDRKIEVVAKNEHLEIRLFRSVSGQIILDSPVNLLMLEDSIVSNHILSEDSIVRDNDKISISASGTPLEIQKCTIFGTVDARQIVAGNSIFNDKLTIDRCQVGCLRFCYLPSESQTPRRFRCQPDLEIKTQIADVENKGNISEDIKNGIRDQVLAWMMPQYTSIFYGDHGFAQLVSSCPVQIRTGAKDGSEMGTFCFLKQPQREISLQTALKDYLNVGLKTGIIYVT